MKRFYGGGCREGREKDKLRLFKKNGDGEIIEEEIEDLKFGQSHDIIYYNINMVNNTPKSVSAETVQNLTGAVLTNAKEYVMATIRFVLDGNTIPIFKFIDGAYWVTIVVGGVPFPEVVVFDPLVSATRDIYSYKAFVAMINTALDDAYIAAGFPGGMGPPFLVYIEPTGVFDLVSPVVAGMSVYMNSRLYGFFGNFWSIFIGENQANHQDYELIIRNNGTNISSPYYTVPANHVVMEQDYQSCFNWFDTTGIVFISNSMGIKPEYLPLGNTTANLTTDSSAGVGPSSIPILTDFQPYIADPSGVRGYLYYASEGPWRLTALESDEIRSIHIKIMLRDRIGNMTPYLIPPNQSVQVKLVFMPKSFYNAGKK